MAYRNQADANEYQRRWRAAHPERARAISRRHYWKDPAKAVARCVQYYRKRMYGLSEDAFQKLLVAQEHCCKICGVELVVPHVDHNHETKEVRGLLCQNCNHLLGNAQEDPAILVRAAFYLTRQL